MSLARTDNGAGNIRYAMMVVPARSLNHVAAANPLIPLRALASFRFRRRDAIPCKSLGSHQPVPKRRNHRDDRRLADDGTSYREILESMRHALAVECVKAGKLGLQEIAFLLGYDSLGNFRRALIRWESMSPSEFRWTEPRS